MERVHGDDENNSTIFDSLEFILDYVIFVLDTYQFSVIKWQAGAYT
jgi:hypothetical protein